MSDRDALFAAILAHPDEDTPRLVFADWLEENGEPPYAAFIRKQIELAKVPDWDALRIRAWHRDRDSTTGRGFHQFVPEFPERLGLTTLTGFRRGFAWHVQSTDVGPFLGYADKLFAAAPIQALTIDAHREPTREPIDLTALFASPHLARIKQLRFKLTRVTAKTVQQMQACPYLGNLTALGFEFSRFETGAVNGLFRPPLIERLESLSFDNSSVAWPEMEAGLANAGGPHRLRRFVLNEYSSGGSARVLAYDAPLLRGLKEFEIHGYDMGESVIRALCRSPVVNGLESLALSRVKPGVPGIKVLSECAALSGLKRLKLWTNAIGPVAAKQLVRSPHLAGLQVLEMVQNPLGDKGAIALAAAPCMSNLIDLELMHCEIGDAGAEALVRALSPDKLVNLELHSSSHKVRLSDDIRKKIREKFGV